MKSKILFSVTILLLSFGIVILISPNSSSQNISVPSMSELTLGINGLVSLDLIGGWNRWNRMYVLDQSSIVPYTMGQYLFSDFRTSSYGSNNLGFTNNLLYFNWNYNGYASNKNYGLTSYNNIFMPFMPAPVYNINIFEDWQNLISLQLVTHTQNGDVNGAGGQTGSKIAQQFPNR